MERSRVRNRARRRMSSKKRDEHTFGTSGLRAGTNTEFQSEPTLVRWLLFWEVTDKKDTWSDGFLVAIRTYIGAMEMFQMTKEQSKENFERGRQHVRLLHLTSKQPLVHCGLDMCVCHLFNDSLLNSVLRLTAVGVACTQLAA